MTPLVYVLMCLAGGDGNLDLTADERFWRDQSKVREPRELLAPFYGWFTERFDTRDLKDAKALLDVLAD